MSLHEAITNIENLLDTNNYNGCIQRFYDLVERCSDSRPVSAYKYKIVSNIFTNNYYILFFRKDLY